MTNTSSKLYALLRPHFYGHCHTVVAWYLKLQVRIVWEGYFKC